MKHLHFLPQVLVYALILCSCAIEINQTVEVTPSPSVDEDPIPAPTSLFPTTHIPITWAHLDLDGKLVYLSSTMEGDVIISNIQSLDLRTGERSTLFRAPRAWMYYASISPDAKALVMSYTPPAQSNSSASRSLYALPLDGTAGPQPLLAPPTPDDHYTQVEWSPDGNYIYYVHYNSKNRPEGQLDPVYDISRMRYPDGPPERIADHAFWPRLSSDSSRLVYISIDPVSGRNELLIANADGRDPQRIAFSGPGTPEIIDAPIFSPDGQFILFSAPVPGRAFQPDWFERLLGVQVAKAHTIPSDWWSVPIAGGTPVQLTNIQTINLFASISPEQQRIASLSGEGLFVMDLDGSNLTQLVSDQGVHGTVSWIP